MSQIRLNARVSKFFACTLLSIGLGAGFLFGCGQAQMPIDTSPSSMEDQAYKALKDKFYVAHNCEVYQKIVTFTCDSGITQAMCKDNTGNKQVDYYMRDPANNAGWLSEVDIDAQIAKVQEQLNALEQQKAGFAPAHNPAYQCSPL